MSNQLQNIDIVFPPLSKYTFKLLAADTFTYALENLGFVWVWDPPSEVESTTNHVFQPELGDAVSLFIDRQKAKSWVFNLEHELTSGTFNDIMEYVDEVLQDILQDDCFLMDVIRILAFFLDLITRFYMDENFHFIEPALDCLDAIYKLHMKKPLFIIGGYYALFRFSKQYVDYYMTFAEPSADVTASIGRLTMEVDKKDTAAESSFTMEVDKKDRFTMDVDTKDFNLEDTTHTAGGNAKSLTPIKFNSKTKEILKQTLMNEFSYPHSEPCPSEFNRAPYLDKCETKTKREGAEPVTPVKCNNKIKKISKQTLRNELSSPYKEHCPSEFSGTPDSVKSETKTNRKSTESVTPIKCNSKIKKILKRTLKSQFSSPRSDHCPSRFSTTPHLVKSETKADPGSAKSVTPNKLNNKIKDILNRALENEFSSPHSDHCPSEFSRTPDSVKSGTKTDSLKRRLSFSD